MSLFKPENVAPSLAVESINRLVKPFLETRFGFTELEKVVKKIQGDAEPDYEAVVHSVEAKVELTKLLGLFNGEFMALFGVDLYELLAESAVEINEVNGRRFAAIQLYSRNFLQVKIAHQILASRGALVFVPMPKSGGGMHDYFTVLVSVELPPRTKSGEIS